ncbi:hypothetical protein QRX60_13805 [Amycolatopsis mongoliensis]|uniref:Uncharacterized protein n=1 Tax=Amycolatopsis mongoliensis TaxID=715475 RepID=A0A9Y2NMH6_9PSEU|nr:hypothetical protein [Amycolatopsis sp. 4-36]WIY04863.1 hypothetical protein QRX60_13805 [Amycolatopsis sp. 4-36]
MISTVASSTKFSAGEVIFAVLMGVVIIGGLTLTIVRARRSMKPRDQQMAVLAAELDGRRQVYFRKMEIGLAQEDLLRVARSRGYSLIDHRVGKYYEFVYTPHQPGRLA